MQNLTPPTPLQLQGNKAEQWKKWKQRWANYCIASGLSTKQAAIQTATFLHVIGEEGMDIFNTFKWEAEGDQSRLETILQRFEEYFVPKKNITFERHIFNSRHQREGETIDDFVKELKTIVKGCEYGDLTESIVKDRIVAGLNDSKLRERLLEKSQLNLDEAIQILKAAEASKAHAQTFTQVNARGPTLSVEVMKAKPKGHYQNNQRKEYRQEPKNGERFNNRGSNSNSYRHTNLDLCRQCGRKHLPRNCPAYNVICHACKGRNHFARMCRSEHKEFSNRFHANSRYRQVAAVQKESLSEENGELFIGQIMHIGDGSKDDWIEKIMINQYEISFKLDTGAQCNILPEHIVTKITNEPLKPSKVKLRSYTKELLKPVGEIELCCFWKKTKYKLNFQVVRGDYAPILGRKDCCKMKMICRDISTIAVDGNISDKCENQIMNKYQDIFEGIGRLPGTYKIQLDENVKPVVHPPRRIPYALEKKVQIELEKMEMEGIICKVGNNEPSDWVSSLVTVEKPNGEVRVCIDPKDLNTAIKRDHHPLTTVAD